jgi:hypothetical protein
MTPLSTMMIKRQPSKKMKQGKKRKGKAVMHIIYLASHGE